MIGSGAQGVARMGGEDRVALAQAFCARLCHDLGGPVGSLSAVMDLGPDAGAEGEALARDSVESLSRRIRLFRLLAGTAEDLSPAALEHCVEGMLAHGKVRLDAGGLKPGAAVPAPAVPPLLSALLLAAEALPRGGTVALAGDPGGAIMIIPNGRGAAWPPALVGLLAQGGQPVELTPRTVLAHWFRATADKAGLAVRLVLGPSGSALLIARAG